MLTQDHAKGLRLDFQLVKIHVRPYISFDAEAIIFIIARDFDDEQRDSSRNH